MTRDEVTDLMKSSKSETDWNANCDKVKAACNGYPDFWWEAIITSGVVDTTKATWAD